MTVAEVQAEILITKALLADLGAAILAVIDPTISHYTLDTGQGTQTVRRENLPALYVQRRELQNELCTLQARISGGGVTRGQPAW